MLRMAGHGDNACSSFPSIVLTWAKEELEVPGLSEDTILRQVTLTVMMKLDSGKITGTTRTT